MVEGHKEKTWKSNGLDGMVFYSRSVTAAIRTSDTCILSRPKSYGSRGFVGSKGDKGMSTCPPPWSQSRVDVQSRRGRTKGVETHGCVFVFTQSHGLNYA